MIGTRERLVTEVQTKLAHSLTKDQLDELGQVLMTLLWNVDLAPRTEPTDEATPNNLSLLDGFLSAKKIEGCSEKSLKYYELTIRALFIKLTQPLSLITTDQLRSYLADYQNERGSSKVTIDNMRRIFSSFFGWLEDEDYVLKSPVRRIHKIRTDKPIKETLSDEKLELLRDTCDNVRDLAIVDMLASTGMRVGELVRLNKADINFQERECVVLGKGGSERVVYFDARTKIHLLSYLNQRQDSNKALLVTMGAPHKRLQIGGVESRLRTLGKRANLIKIHPHKFRRTLATRAIDKGMPIEQVQRLLGHVRIDTTMHYAMVDQMNVKNSHRKFIG